MLQVATARFLFDNDTHRDLGELTQIAMSEAVATAASI